MADLVSSNLLAFQSRISDRYAAKELREQQNPILATALGYSNFIVDDPMAVKESERRSVYAYYIKRKAATNGTARAYNHTGTQGDSVQVALSWSTFSETFGINLTAGLDNVFKNQVQFDNQMLQAMRNLRERIGLSFLTSLHASRTQVKNATIKNLAWNVTNFAFENASLQSNFFAQNAISILRQHKYYDKIDFITDSVINKQFDFLRAQGAGNSTNYSFQFQDVGAVMEHPLLSTSVVTTYANGIALAMPQYSFSAIPWLPSINRKGQGDMTSYVGGFGTIADPTTPGLTYALHGYSNRVDASASNGSAQDVKMEFELSVDISFQIAPLSTANETPIFEIGQL
jgi:hypothetical protein